MSELIYFHVNISTHSYTNFHLVKLCYFQVTLYLYVEQEPGLITKDVKIKNATVDKKG